MEGTGREAGVQELERRRMEQAFKPNEKYMRHAINLAKTAAGHTSPNPMVGAVIVKEDRIIGLGCHERYGGLHAERKALGNLTESAEGADMYVTLEPCCHYGKQPPCTEAVIASGIKRVIIGSADPNPRVAGKGVRQLRAAGIEVIEDFLRQECDSINPVFFHYITRKIPYVALKYAMTADGRIATDAGRSMWITGEEARAHVHELRNYYSGILAGIGTVLADDPLLTCRLPGGRSPVRIILDSDLRIPLESRLVQTAKETPLIVIRGKEDLQASQETGGTPADPDKEEIRADRQTLLEEAGVTVLTVGKDEYGLRIPEVLRELGKRKIDGILVEGGSRVNASFVRAGAVQHIYAYIGAKIFGGSKYPPVREAGILQVEDALELTDPKVQIFGSDVLLEYDCPASAGVRMRAPG